MTKKEQKIKKVEVELGEATKKTLARITEIKTELQKDFANLVDKEQAIISTLVESKSIKLEDVVNAEVAEGVLKLDVKE